jgi:O-antigen/teichoic acid export membrane protein
LLKFKQIKDLEKYKENSLSNEKIIIAKIILYSIIFYLIIALVYIFLPDELFDPKIVQIIRLLLITVPFM